MSQLQAWQSDIGSLITEISRDREVNVEVATRQAENEQG